MPGTLHRFFHLIQKRTLKHKKQRFRELLSPVLGQREETEAPRSGLGFSASRPSALDFSAVSAYTGEVVSVIQDGDWEKKAGKASQRR